MLHEQHDKDINVGELAAAFWARYPEADRHIYGNMLTTLGELNISKEIAHDILTETRKRKGAIELSEKAFKLAQGSISEDEFKNAYDEHFGKVDHAIELPLAATTTELDELIDAAYKSQGLRWRLDCLNKSLGSLRSGDFGFIFARPETGKTTFLASEVTAFIDQCSQPVVWFNNEEQGHKVMLRIYQAYFGVTIDQLMSNRRKYAEEFRSRVGNKFLLFDSASIHKRDVSRIIEELNPGVVIYDQIDKIKGFDADREDLRLGSIYQWARELAKGSHAAIGVCQSDGTGEGVRYLTMDHVANAKTSKQAEADFILGIGKTHNMDEEYVRFLNISKNKLFGDEDSIPELKHGHFEVLIEPQIARYRDIVKYN